MAHYDMALRLGGLADLDPAAVPLPIGTDVTTRVDRMLADGEPRPQGASGRRRVNSGPTELSGRGRVNSVGPNYKSRRLGAR